jgi:hypothetical protein
MSPRLVIRNFAQIEAADIRFGDLTQGQRPGEPVLHPRAPLHAHQRWLGAPASTPIARDPRRRAAVQPEPVRSINTRESTQLFPRDRTLKRVYRERVDEAMFHGGTIGVEQHDQFTKRLRLKFAGKQETSLPFMTWTAGQREFTPLLLGLYHLLPARKHKKADNIDWVVIEEPEMGLHPEAVTVVMLLVLDLLWRGYRVVLSTHSPAVIAAVWALRQLAKNKASYQLVCDAFDVPPQHRAAMRPIAEAALERSFATYVTHYKAGRTITSNISSLDPGDEDDTISEWGGLSSFASRFGSAVSAAVNQASMRKR